MQLNKDELVLALVIVIILLVLALLNVISKPFCFLFLVLFAVGIYSKQITLKVTKEKAEE